LKNRKLGYRILITSNHYFHVFCDENININDFVRVFLNCLMIRMNQKWLNITKFTNNFGSSSEHIYSDSLELTLILQIRMITFEKTY
jgi:hypothetical protein